MSRFCRVLFYVSLAIFVIRLGWLNDDPNYTPPELTLVEFSIWAVAWTILTQAGMFAAATQCEKKLLGVLSWAIISATIVAWVIPYEMDNTTKIFLLTLLIIGLFFPVSDVTEWRPWQYHKR